MPNLFLQARKTRRMTQAHLAIAAGIDERTVRKLEKGDNVSPETIRAVAAVLEIDLAAGRTSTPALRSTPQPPTLLQSMVSRNTAFLQVLLVVQFVAAIMEPPLFAPLLTISGSFMLIYVAHLDPPQAGMDRVMALFATVGAAATLLFGQVTLTMKIKSTPGALPDDSVWVASFMGGAFLFAISSGIVAFYALTFARSTRTGRTLPAEILRWLHPRRLGPRSVRFFRTVNGMTPADSPHVDTASTFPKER